MPKSPIRNVTAVFWKVSGCDGNLSILAVNSFFVINFSDGHTERGCLSNLEGDEFVDCLVNRNSTKCLTCVGDQCNQEVVNMNTKLSCVENNACILALPQQSFVMSCLFFVNINNL